MPKAKKPAPFAIFVEEFRQRSRLQGVIYTSFEDASTYASELWNVSFLTVEFILINNYVIILRYTCFEGDSC